MKIFPINRKRDKKELVAWLLLLFLVASFVGGFYNVNKYRIYESYERRFATGNEVGEKNREERFIRDIKERKVEKISDCGKKLYDYQCYAAFAVRSNDKDWCYLVYNKETRNACLDILIEGRWSLFWEKLTGTSARALASYFLIFCFWCAVLPAFLFYFFKQVHELTGLLFANRSGKHIKWWRWAATLLIILLFWFLYGVFIKVIFAVYEFMIFGRTSSLFRWWYNLRYFFIRFGL